MTEQPPPPPSWGPQGDPTHAWTGPVPQGETSGKAVAALVTGLSALVFSLCCLGFVGIVAVVLGVQARRDIRLSQGRLDGSGVAMGGIVSGALAVVVSLGVAGALAIVIATGSAEFSIQNT